MEMDFRAINKQANADHIWRRWFEGYPEGEVTAFFFMSHLPQTLPEALVGCVGKLWASSWGLKKIRTKNIFSSWRILILKNIFWNFWKYFWNFKNSFSKKYFFYIKFQNPIYIGKIFFTKGIFEISKIFSKFPKNIFSKSIFSMMKK